MYRSTEQIPLIGFQPAGHASINSSAARPRQHREESLYRGLDSRKMLPWARILLDPDLCPHVHLARPDSLVAALQNSRLQLRKMVFWYRLIVH